MTVGVWQPYFFPYIGYFQAIHASDVFVLYDDVNFIKRGFIHRNSILAHGKEQRFTIPLKGASQNKRILEIERSEEFGPWSLSFKRMLHHAYGSSAHYTRVIEMLDRSFQEHTISGMARVSIEQTLDYLGVSRNVVQSSDLAYDREGSAEERIQALVKSLDGDRYVNPEGGRALYNEDSFSEVGLKLKFIQTDWAEAKNLLGEHAGLSMLHLLFTQDPATIRAALGAYSLID